MTASFSVGVGILSGIADVAQLVERELPKLRDWWNTDQPRADKAALSLTVPAGGSMMVPRQNPLVPAEHGVFVGGTE